MSKPEVPHERPAPKNVWITEKEEILIDSPFMKFYTRDCRSSEDDRRHRFYLFRSRDWCNLIPVTEDGKVVLVRQYRIGISEHTLEIPGGVVDRTDDGLIDAAIRELEEETGYVPLSGAKREPLGWTWPNPAIQNNRCHSFIIGPVRRSGKQKLDAGEMIEVVEVPLEKIPGMIASGEIRHALILNAFLQLLLSNPGARETLASRLHEFS